MFLMSLILMVFAIVFTIFAWVFEIQLHLMEVFLLGMLIVFCFGLAMVLAFFGLLEAFLVP